jgi:hypothetical protein
MLGQLGSHPPRNIQNGPTSVLRIPFAEIPKVRCPARVTPSTACADFVSASRVVQSLVSRGNDIGLLVISQIKMSNGRPCFHVKDYCLDQVADAVKLVRKKTREAKFFVRASRAPGTE